jgi:hypothetical protein
MAFSGTTAWYWVAASYDGEQQLPSAYYDFNYSLREDFSYEMAYDALGDRSFVDNKEMKKMGS